MKEIFIFKGRYTRLMFWMTQLCVGLLTALICVIAIVSLKGVEGHSTITLISLLFLIPVYWVAWAAGAKRCRDFNESGYFVLTTLIPYVGLLFFLYIGLKKTKPVQDNGHNNNTFN